jgi:hypothetical protein
MDRVIDEMLNLGICTELLIDQVKIVQENGELCVAYPDRTDLKALEGRVNLRREVCKVDGTEEGNQ